MSHPRKLDGFGLGRDTGNTVYGMIRAPLRAIIERYPQAMEWTLYYFKEWSAEKLMHAVLKF